MASRCEKCERMREFVIDGACLECHDAATVPSGVYCWEDHEQTEWNRVEDGWLSVCHCGERIKRINISLEELLK